MISDEMTGQAELSARRATLVAGYQRSWARMIREWSAPRQTDAVWLMYAGNYLFNTRGLRWAVDPVTLCNRVPEAPLPNVQDLRGLSFVLLTHAHVDHVDVRLWNELKESGCHWIVPEHMVSLFLGETSLRQERFSVAVPSSEIELDGIHILPYDSLHDERNDLGQVTAVPATGYLARIGESRYLLPGDIRTYDAAALPPLAPAKVVFAHVFLGRSAALQPSPPLLSAFVEFYRAFRPEKILLTHLYELSRNRADCWCDEHAQLIKATFEKLDGRIEVVIPMWYEETIL